MCPLGHDLADDSVERKRLKVQERKNSLKNGILKTKEVD